MKINWYNLLTVTPLVGIYQKLEYKHRNKETGSLVQNLHGRSLIHCGYGNKKKKKRIKPTLA